MPLVFLYNDYRYIEAKKKLNLYSRKYGTTSPAIVKGRYKPIKLMRQGGT